MKKFLKEKKKQENSASGVQKKIDVTIGMMI